MKQQTKKVNPWKIGMLTTLCAFLFVLFACTEERAKVLEASLQNDKREVQREIFTKVKEQPSYKGGMEVFYQYVASEVRYPLEARENGVEGTVQVQFDIERSGSISNVLTVSGIGSGCDDEVLRVIKNAKDFIAGSQRGRTVKVNMVMPVTFKLNPDKRNSDGSIQGSITVGKAIPNNGSLAVTAKWNNGEWSGTVKDPDGNAIPGTNIVLVGTKYGTVSGMDGTFKVKAEKGQELSISYVGYSEVRLNSN